ncbi:MAG: amino acid permease [Pirellulales bacterium]|nr:amino acid permease [Pirellulales bacterium]
MPTQSDPQTPRRQLSLFDSVNIIVGIVIGTGIFATPQLAAMPLDSEPLLMMCWVAGGLVSLMGALCYAELIVRFPKAGGDYHFLKGCYGRRLGFVFAWTQFWVVRPGSIGAMAFIFAQYFQESFAPTADQSLTIVWAIALIAVVTLLNVLGLRVGKTTQNMLTCAKVVGMLAIFVCALLTPSAQSVEPGLTENAETVTSDVTEEASPMHALLLSALAIGQSLIFVMFAFGGWTDIAFVGAEVRRPEHNTFRAMTIGVVVITTVYLLMNFSYLHVLGFEGLQTSNTVAASTARIAIGGWGERFLSALILISSAGALNGIVLTGSRIYYAFGQDHALFSWLGKWHQRFTTPVNSLLMQGIVTCGLTALFGSQFWARFFQGEAGGNFRPADGFERMVLYTAPAYWFFVTLVVLSLYYYRRKHPVEKPPFRVPGYPVTPMLFTLVCAGIIYSTMQYAIDDQRAVYEAFWSAGLVFLGLLVSFFSRPPNKA